MILRNEYYKAKSLTLGIARSFYSMSLGVIKRMYGFEKILTINYPKEMYQYGARLNGLPQMILDQKGKSLCTSCGKCADICPTGCLEIKGVEAKEPEVFNLDAGKCIFCSYCVEICEKDALEMGREHILASHVEESLILNLSELKSRGRKRL